MWLTGNNVTDTSQCNQCKGFTFIELMVALVVLCTGLVFIIQGLITAAGVLNTMQNDIAAFQFLDGKMQELELAAKKDTGIKREDSEGDFSFAERNFTWNLEVTAVEKEEELDLSEDLNQICLKVAWQERNQPKDLSAFTYLRNKKE